MKIERQPIEGTYRGYEYSYRMRIEEVVAINAAYTLVDYFTRRGDRADVPVRQPATWFATDIRVAFSDEIPRSDSDRRCLPTSWFREISPAHGYKADLTPKAKELQSVLSSSRLTLWQLFQNPDLQYLQSEAILSRQPIKILDGHVILDATVPATGYDDLNSPMEKLYHQLGWYLEGPNYRYTMDPTV